MSASPALNPQHRTLVRDPSRASSLVQVDLPNKNTPSTLRPPQHHQSSLAGLTCRIRGNPDVDKTLVRVGSRRVPGSQAFDSPNGGQRLEWRSTGFDPRPVLAIPAGETSQLDLRAPLRSVAATKDPSSENRRYRALHRRRHETPHVKRATPDNVPLVQRSKLVQSRSEYAQQRSPQAPRQSRRRPPQRLA